MKQKTFVEYKGEPIYYNDNHFSDEEEMFDYYDDENVFEAELCDTSAGKILLAYPPRISVGCVCGYFGTRIA
jgi:hypothetical protein